MLPELRKLIKENQKLLYTLRKGEENLSQKQKHELSKKTVSNKILMLESHKIILDTVLSSILNLLFLQDFI